MDNLLDFLSIIVERYLLPVLVPSTVSTSTSPYLILLLIICSLCSIGIAITLLPILWGFYSIYHALGMEIFLMLLHSFYFA